MSEQKPKQLPGGEATPAAGNPLAKPAEEGKPARRMREREFKEREMIEIPEKVLLARILMNKEQLDNEDRLKVFELLLKDRVADNERIKDLYTAQRQFIYAQLESEKNKAAIIQGVLNSNIDITNKLGTSIVEAAQAKGAQSKAAEVIEIINAVSQMPILAPIFGIAGEALAEWLQERKEKKAKKKAKEEAEAKAKAKQLEEKNKT